MHCYCFFFGMLSFRGSSHKRRGGFSFHATPNQMILLVFYDENHCHGMDYVFSCVVFRYFYLLRFNKLQSEAL